MQRPGLPLSPVIPMAQRIPPGHTPPASSRHNHGLTLIELVVALAIFAILGVLTYRATSQLMVSSHSIEDELQRWRDINRAMHIIDNELLQVVAPQIPNNGTRALPLYSPAAQERDALSLLAMSSEGLPERVVFRITDNGELEWRRRPDLHPETPWDSDILLDRIAGLQWRFLSAEKWHDHWPNTGKTTARNTTATAGATSFRLPQAVELQLTLQDNSVLRRVYALR